MSDEDNIDHPPHYGGEGNPYEAIKVIEAWGLGFHLGNVVKYISRAGQKGDYLEDLKKAQWYMNRAVEFEERTTRPAEEPTAQQASDTMIKAAVALVQDPDLWYTCQTCGGVHQNPPHPCEAPHRYHVEGCPCPLCKPPDDEVERDESKDPAWLRHALGALRAGSDVLIVVPDYGEAMTALYQMEEAGADRRGLEAQLNQGGAALVAHDTGKITQVVGRSADLVILLADGPVAREASQRARGRGAEVISFVNS